MADLMMAQRMAQQQQLADRPAQGQNPMMGPGISMANPGGLLGPQPDPESFDLLAMVNSVYRQGNTAAPYSMATTKRNDPTDRDVGGEEMIQHGWNPRNGYHNGTDTFPTGRPGGMAAVDFQMGAPTKQGWFADPSHHLLMYRTRHDVRHVYGDNQRGVAVQLQAHPDTHGSQVHRMIVHRKREETMPVHNPRPDPAAADRRIHTQAHMLHTEGRKPMPGQTREEYQLATDPTGSELPSNGALPDNHPMHRVAIRAHKRAGVLARAEGSHLHHASLNNQRMQTERKVERARVALPPDAADGSQLAAQAAIMDAQNPTGHALTHPTFTLAPATAVHLPETEEAAAELDAPPEQKEPDEDVARTVFHAGGDLDFADDDGATTDEAETDDEKEPSPPLRKRPRVDRVAQPIPRGSGFAMRPRPFEMAQ